MPRRDQSGRCPHGQGVPDELRVAADRGAVGGGEGVLQADAGRQAEPARPGRPSASTARPRRAGAARPRTPTSSRRARTPGRRSRRHDLDEDPGQVVHDGQRRGVLDRPDAGLDRDGERPQRADQVGEAGLGDVDGGEVGPPDRWELRPAGDGALPGGDVPPVIHSPVVTPIGVAGQASRTAATAAPTSAGSSDSAPAASRGCRCTASAPAATASPRGDGELGGRAGQGGVRAGRAAAVQRDLDPGERGQHGTKCTTAWTAHRPPTAGGAFGGRMCGVVMW